MKKIIFLFSIILVVFSGCKEADLCEGVICNNGGTCENGNCKCDSIHTGTNCNDTLPPAKITITEIKVIKFPADNNGSSWDPAGNEADLKITAPGYSSGVLTDCAPLFVYTYTPSPAIQITNITGTYTFTLYDDDAGTLEVMSVIDVYFPYEIYNFPSSIILTSADTKTKLQLAVSYSW